MSESPEKAPEPEKPQSEVQKQVFDALKHLLDFQKWAYDTYQRDSNFFLAIEVLLFGGVANAVLTKSPLDGWSSVVALIGVLLGIFLTMLWAGRQRREFYLAKGRLERLRELERLLPESFWYFGTVYLQSQKHIAESRPLPLVGSWVRVVPNIYKKTSFLYSVVLQQSIFVAWFGIGAVVLLRAVTLS